MELATAYYPEYFSESEWDRDFKTIREAGIQGVRFGEFCWSQLEPREGEYDFSILDKGIEAAARHGLKVILCTPTACPPKYLCEKYPDLFPVNAWGRQTVFGARQHRCYHHKGYLDASLRLVTELAKRYGGDERVFAWQIDNELCGEQKKCYCPRCREAFQEWLRGKYGSAEELNRRWGGHFWSEDYGDFAQIDTPKIVSMDLYVWQNPSLNLEFTRFSSDGIISFCRMQEKILHAYTKAPVTTNTDDFYYGDTLDLWKLYQSLDVAAFDCYTEEEYQFAFYCDFLRSVKGGKPFWVLENGDGSKNLTRMMEIAEERGCALYSIFKFRPFPWGQEQGRKSLIDLYGRPAPNLKAVREYASRAVPMPPLKARVGLVYDFGSSWAYQAKSLMLDPRDGLRYPDYLLHTVYKALYEMGIPVDILTDDSALSGYDAVLAPLHILHHPVFSNSLLEYLEQGGVFLSDTELFLKNEDNVYLENGTGVYQRVFAAQGGLPLFEDDPCLPLSVSYGKGRAVLLTPYASKEAWESILLELGMNRRKEDLI